MIFEQVKKMQDAGWLPNYSILNFNFLQFSTTQCNVAISKFTKSSEACSKPLTFIVAALDSATILHNDPCWFWRRVKCFHIQHFIQNGKSRRACQLIPMLIDFAWDWIFGSRRQEAVLLSLFCFFCMNRNFLGIFFIIFSQLNIMSFLFLTSHFN